MHQYSNGTCQDSPEEEGREPSYVRLARCLSGYSTLNYDPSKQVLGRSPSPMRPSQEIVDKTPPPPKEEVTTSFIEQRIERLYGPGALAQVFYRSPCSKAPARTPKPEPTQQRVQVDRSKTAPVMRLLRPEFRDQLTSAPQPSPSTPKRPVAKRFDTVDACKPSRNNLISQQELKDGHYFLKKLDEEVKGLERVARDCEVELGECKSETGCGVLRAVSGKARLLVAEKLNQFRGLCNKNINRSPSEDFPTTDEDLAGFWDMVMIQVDDVHSQHRNLDKLRKNGWIEEVVNGDREKSKVKSSSAFAKSKSSSVVSKGESEASKARDAARRKMLQERRQAMKQAKPLDSNEQPPSSSLFTV